MPTPKDKSTTKKTTKAKTPVKKATVKAKPKAKPKAKAKAKAKRKGRPSKFTQALADKLCAELAQGKSMRTVTKSTTMPHMATIFRWLRIHDDFCEQYTRAKEESADALTDEMLDIADNATNDYMEELGKDGQSKGYQLNGDHVRRSTLRIETRKWLASKLKPKRYGNNVSVAVKESKEFSKENLGELEAYLKENGIDPTQL